MGAEESRRDIDRQMVREAPGGLQHSTLGCRVEAVARLDLDGRHALPEERADARQGALDQRVDRGLPGRPHGRDDAAAGPGNLLVRRAVQPLFEFSRPVAAIDDMGVAVDQPRRDPRLAGVVHRHTLYLRPVQLRRRTDPGNIPAGHGDRAVRHSAVRVFAGRHHGSDPGVGPQAVPGAHDQTSQSLALRYFSGVYCRVMEIAAPFVGRTAATRP